MSIFTKLRYLVTIHEDKTFNWKKEAFSWLKILTISATISYSVTAFFMPSFVVGTCMIPTINNHNYILIDRASYIFGTPKRKDIIVCISDTTASGVEITHRIAKRIIAVAGDRVQVTGGQVFINGIRLSEPYVYGKETGGYFDDTVPPGCYFVMGDNRENSLDSRFSEIGFIRRENIIGKVAFIIIPPSSIVENKTILAFLTHR